MDIEILSPKKPTSTIPISALDLIFGLFYTDHLYFYEPGLDIDRMRDALQCAIDDYPVFAGRLILNDGRFIVEAGGHVDLAIETRNDDPPLFGDSIFPIESANLLHNNTPPATYLQQSIEAQPLLTLKLTIFKGGQLCIGVRNLHLIADGSSFMSFFAAWSGYYSGIDGPKGLFDRDLIAGIAASSSSPSRLENEERVTRPQFFNLKFDAVGLSSDDFHRLSNISFPGSPSVPVNYLLQALVCKAYAKSTIDQDDTIVVNVPFDLRWIKEIGLPKDYFGNAIIIRPIQLSKQAILQAGLAGVALEMKDKIKSISSGMKDDVACYQKHFIEGKHTSYGSYLEIPSPLSNGGLYLNNCVGFSAFPTDFGGRYLWNDIILEQPFGVQTAMLLSNPQGGVSVRLVLRAAQIGKFKAAWSELLDAVLKGDIA